jgi:hypothetical protein
VHGFLLGLGTYGAEDCAEGCHEYGCELHVWVVMWCGGCLRTSEVKQEQEHRHIRYCGRLGSLVIGTGTELWLTEAGTSPHFADAAFWSKTKAYAAEKCVRGCRGQSYISRLQLYSPTRAVPRTKHCGHIHHRYTVSLHQTQKKGASHE